MQIAIQMGLELEEEEEPKGSDLSILLVNISYYSNDGKNIFLFLMLLISTILEIVGLEDSLAETEILSVSQLSMLGGDIFSV